MDHSTTTSLNLLAIAIAEEVIDAKTPRDIVDLLKSEFHSIFAKGKAHGIEQSLNLLKHELAKLRDIH